MRMRKLLSTVTLLTILLSLGPVSLVSATEPPPPPEEPSVTVRKFNDVNGNGVQDAGEPNIEGWLIRLYRADHTGLYIVAEGLTGPDGTVTFSGEAIVVTSYKVWEEARECWEPTTPEVYGPWEGGYYTRILLRWDDKSATVVFGNKNTCEPPPPPPGGEGCTPGYWKQEHHFDSWVNYTPTDSFDAIFGVDVGGKTLLEALKMRGGKDKALMRHAAAALLNASGGVSYLYSEAEITSLVQAAFVSGDFNWTKALFEEQNEAGCPLN